ncbi:MAG: DNA primase [Limimaricola sp.]|uniref:DNA primase n=1 Tax=Limimaricola sp. TaxID=2211665 RepID=UPI001DD2F688|nr:DNA primase [Limimaricola sp.]MBI1416105.1 DNA primase [Limimaricola sp.]
MSLSPAFIDELRARLSLAQVVGRKVIWDNKKSNPGKGDLWAPCPFHQEKTASFHVDDRKGFFYCFGCHAKGDAISFVQQSENVSFVEAIEILAREAGLPLPERDPAAQEKADTRSRLSEVMEKAVQFYRLQLKTAAGAEARAYLARRGLDEAARDRWGIGFAPPGWETLREGLAAKGVSEADMLAAGLLKPSDKGRKPYDVFRNRIMFPIRDARGRAIAFGGRAMDPGESAKYLNSPETVLFDKGRSLYNHGPAREAAGKGAPLIVAEGYMDVIALAEAGFGGAVAPLGTAVTETQLEMLWRIAPEPVVALDGDAAGLKAAMRLIGLVLPLLQAGRSLRFALLPEGKDPDELIRDRGTDAMRKAVEGAVPLVELLWRRETEGRVFDSPERRAALDKALRDAIAVIPDAGLRGHYDSALREKARALFRPQRAPFRPGAARGSRFGPVEPWRREMAPMASSRASALAAGDGTAEELHEAVILAALVATPVVLPEFVGELERLDMHSALHRRLRDALLRLADVPDPGAALAAEIGAEALEKLMRQSHVAISPPVRRPGDPETARMCLAEELAKLNARRGHAREVADAVEDMSGLVDEGLTWRLGQAAQALQRAGHGSSEDRGEYVTGANGVQIRKDERDAFQKLMDEIDFAKPERPTDSH